MKMREGGVTAAAGYQAGRKAEAHEDRRSTGNLQRAGEGLPDAEKGSVEAIKDGSLPDGGFYGGA